MADAVVQEINYIVKTPGFRHGEPHFAGRHLSVDGVVYGYVRLGATVEELADSYELTPAQVHAALAYYYDHTAEIQAIWAENDRLSDMHKMPPGQANAERDRLLSKMKERNPEGYEQFMRAQAERTEEERRSTKQ